MNICDDCKGECYPLQCRKQAGWREAQGAPDACPFGLSILPEPPPAAASLTQDQAAVDWDCVFGERECKGCPAHPKIHCHRLGLIVPALSCKACDYHIARPAAWSTEPDRNAKRTDGPGYQG